MKEWGSNLQPINKDTTSFLLEFSLFSPFGVVQTVVQTILDYNFSSRCARALRAGALRAGAARRALRAHANGSETSLTASAVWRCN